MSAKAKPVAYDDGLRVYLLEVDRNALKDDLPAMIYDLKPTKNGPILVKVTQGFELPKRLLGTVIHERRDKIVNAFMSGRRPLGAMGIGQKGTGKTEQMQVICNTLIGKGVPVIRIAEPCSKSDIELAVRMAGRCVLFFDEYGKVYKDHKEESEQLKNELLTLFSDASLGSVLFLLTDNSTRNFNDFLLERPTRIRYRFDYAGCSRDIVEDVCKINKLSKVITDWVVQHAAQSGESIDGIMAICSEGKEAKSLPEFIEAFSILNVIKPKYLEVTGSTTNGDVTVSVADKIVTVTFEDKSEKFTVGKHPIIDERSSHEVTIAGTITRLRLESRVKDPGSSYKVTLGVYSRNPWS